MSVKTLSVACPTCQKQVVMTAESPYRPFCSERCKAIDFGEWATENHSIPGPEVNPTDDESFDEY